MDLGAVVFALGLSPDYALSDAETEAVEAFIASVTNPKEVRVWILGDETISVVFKLPSGLYSSVSHTPMFELDYACEPACAFNIAMVRPLF